MNPRMAAIASPAAVAFLLVAVASADFPPSPAEGPEFRFGAIRTGLHERMDGDPPDEAGSGAWSGFVILNVDPCLEVLKTNARLLKGLPSAVYDVYVKTNGAGSDAPVGQFATNARGIGGGEFGVDVGTYAGSEGPGMVDVQVVVKPAGTAEIVGYATATVTVQFPACPEDPSTPE